jgi:hypothetical protein
VRHAQLLIADAILTREKPATHPLLRRVRGIARHRLVRITQGVRDISAQHPVERAARLQGRQEIRDAQAQTFTVTARIS